MRASAPEGLRLGTPVQFPQSAEKAVRRAVSPRWRTRLDVADLPGGL